MRRPRRRIVAILGGAALAALIARGCILRRGESPPERGEGDAAQISEEGGAQVITLGPRAIEADVISAVPLARAVHRDERNVFGVVLAPSTTPPGAEEGQILVLVLPGGEEAAAAPRGPARITLPGGTAVSALPAGGAAPPSRGLVYRAPGGASPPPPGTMLPVALPAGPERAGFLIPDTAVVWADGKAWVYIPRGENAFARREIAAETRAEGGWFVADGFSPGDRVVVAGAQLLLSEAYISQYKIIEIAE